MPSIIICVILIIWVLIVMFVTGKNVIILSGDVFQSLNILTQKLQLIFVFGHPVIWIHFVFIIAHSRS